MQLLVSTDIMVEHIASYLGKDPIDIKFANLYKKNQVSIGNYELKYCNLKDIYTSKDTDLFTPLQRGVL